MGRPVISDEEIVKRFLDGETIERVAAEAKCNSFSIKKRLSVARNEPPPVHTDGVWLANGENNREGGVWLVEAPARHLYGELLEQYPGGCYSVCASHPDLPKEEREVYGTLEEMTTLFEKRRLQVWGLFWSARIKAKKYRKGAGTQYSNAVGGVKGVREPILTTWSGSLEPLTRRDGST